MQDFKSLRSVRLIGACALAALLLSGSARAADNATRWDLGLICGYALWPAALWDVEYQRDGADGERHATVHDDSRLDPNVYYGLSAAWSPAVGRLRLSVGLDALYAGFRGSIQGRYEIDNERDEYELPLFVSLWQVNLPLRLYLYEGRFSPYVMLGPGAALFYYEIDSEQQQAYAAQALTAVGVEAAAADWLSLGIELRFQGSFGQRLEHDIDENDSLSAGLNYLPLSLAVTARFSR